MSNDLEDLVDYSLDDDQVNDHEMASVSNAAEQVTDPEDDLPPVPQLPSDSELRLSKRVLELERERDALATQLKDLQQQYPSHSTTIPAPQHPQLHDRITVPPDLLPVLSLLRQHIQDLTRDNAALRYTLLGTRHDTAALSRMPLDSTPGSSMSTTPVILDTALGVSEDGVDLAAVVERVKTLMIENDELGDMVAEAGRVDGAEWMKTWEDSKAVIESLESDLEVNVGVVEELRSELDKYKQRFGPLDGKGGRNQGDRERNGGRGNGRQQDDRDRNRQPRDNRDRGPRKDGRQDRQDGRQDGRQDRQDGRQDRQDGRQDGRQDRHDGRQERQDGPRQDSGSRDTRQDKPGISIMGAAAAARREEDRASKRRR